MKNHMRKVLSSVLLLSLILSQSSSLIYSIKASSEYVSDIVSEELNADSETVEMESSQSEQAISEDATTSEEGIISKVVNSFKSDRSLARATNGAASIEIVGYDESVGMSQDTIYEVKVTADFGSDVTSSGKTLEFTLPDGMIFKQIPVVTGLYNTTGVDTTILAPMGSDDPLTGATTNITLPVKEGVTGSTFGTVKYEFNEGTKGVGITFKVQMDYKKIVNSHQLSEDMSVVVTSQGSEVGNISQTMKTQMADRQVGYAVNNLYTTYEVLASTSEDQYVGVTTATYVNGNTSLAVKNAVMYLYYPEGAEYIDVFSPVAGFTATNDPANSRVILTQNKEYYVIGGAAIATYVKYYFPEGTVAGTYSNPRSNYIEYELYNGEKYTVNHTATPYSVTVIEDKVNEMTLLAAFQTADDNTTSSISQSSVAVQIANTKVYEVENQVVEWIVDQNLNTNVVTFPYDIATNGDQPVTRVEYKTHQEDQWQTFTQSQLDEITYTNTLGVIELSDIGLSATETLSHIKIWTGAYNTNYVTASSVGTTNNLIGLFADVITPATSGDVQFKMYSELDQSSTEISTIKTIRASENDAEMKATSWSTMQYYNSDGTLISNAIAGDTVIAKGSLYVYSYFEATRNLQTIQAPALYIRETDEYKVDINKLKLTYSGSEVDYTYEKQEDVNGNVVYKVMTSSDVEVGSLFDSVANQFVKQSLSIEVPIITDPLATSDINNNDLILYGSSKFDITGVTYNASTVSVTDVHDMDGDGSTTDSVLANASKTLLLKPNTNIIVKSAFSKDGTDANVEYINGDDSTAAVLKPGETYEYIATVINNAGESVDEFTAIIPVPKTGDNWGSFFQDEAFTWTMTLAYLPTAPDGFEFYYSTDVTPSTVLSGGTWTKNPKNLDDVKMIKMVANHTIVAGETVEVRVPYTIGETYDSTISGNKAGNVDAFKVAYEQKTSSYNGVLSGTWAGATYILAPEIELEDLNYIVGNSADLEEKVVATDFYGEQIDMSDITYDGSNVPVVDGLYSEVGTYQVEYTAVDRNGLTVTGTRLIKIDGLPEVEAEDQVYYITESDIEGQVDDAGVGYANRAGSEVGSALIREEIGTTYEILSYSETLTEESSEVGSETSSEVGSETSSEVVNTVSVATRSVVDQTFDKVGYYDVKYTAVDSFGQVAEKTVLVTVLDVEETPSEPTEEPSEEDSETKSDKLSDMTIADTGVNLVGAIIATLAILISLIVIKKNLRIKSRN